MREFEEFTQYRQRFKPFRKLSETQIDDIIAAFENKAKYLIENEIQKLKLNFQNAQKCNERNFDKKWMSKFWLKYMFYDFFIERWKIGRFGRNSRWRWNWWRNAKRNERRVWRNADCISRYISK